VRIAPVIASGSSRPQVRRASSAVSSIVSVPWVITAPAAPSATTASHAAFSARAIEPGSRFTPGTFDAWCTRSSATSSSCGTAATSSSPLSAGRAGVPVMAIVPPVATS